MRKFDCLRLLSASMLLLSLWHQAPAAVAAAVVTPHECFQSFVTALKTAKSLDNVEQYFSQPLRTSYKGYSAAQKEAKLKELKEYYITNYRVTTEKINGAKDKATATFSAKGRGYAENKEHKKRSFVQTDNLTYVKEGHYWRISTAKFTRSNH